MDAQTITAASSSQQSSKDQLELKLDIDMPFLYELEEAGVFYVLGRVLEGLVGDLLHILRPYPLPEDAKLYPWEQIVKDGYQFEEFNITTEDGYILSLWHVWKAECQLKEYPVFLQHGLVDLAGTWFYNPGTRSLGLLLADECHDVWAGNNRGTVNSFRHTDPTITDDTAAYWDFSFDEMGRYDLPANVDFVRNHTNKEKVIYIGHSQGSIQFWIQNCLNDTFAQKIKAMGALSPIMYVGNQTSWFVDVQVRFHIFDFLNEYFWTYLYFREGRNVISNVINAISPRLIQILPRATWAIVGSLVGYNDQVQIGWPRFPVVVKNDVGGTGMTNLMHWVQNMQTGSFQTLQRGEEGLEDYPVDVLKENLAPIDEILFIVGSKDALSVRPDIDRLMPLLPQDKFSGLITVPDYNHLDILWAKDVDQKVNQKLL